MDLDLDTIRQGLSNKTLFLHKNKIYTKAEWDEIQNAKNQEEHYDLLQLTKKIQL